MMIMILFWWWRWLLFIIMMQALSQPPSASEDGDHDDDEREDVGLLSLVRSRAKRKDTPSPTWEFNFNFAPPKSKNVGSDGENKKYDIQKNILGNNKQHTNNTSKKNHLSSKFAALPPPLSTAHSPTSTTSTVFLFTLSEEDHRSLSPLDRKAPKLGNKVP